jgi:hypothetical protein
MDCDAAAASGRIDRRTLLRTAGALASLPTRAQSAK